MEDVLPVVALAIGLAAATLVAGAALSRDTETILPLPVAAENLDRYRWEKRAILVFAGAPGDPRYTQQMEALMRVGPGLRTRDVVVLADDDPARAARLRHRLAPAGFTVLLVGKDGGIKLRASVPISAERFFDTIDAMPMRQREMGD